MASGMILLCLLVGLTAAADDAPALAATLKEQQWTSA